MTSVEPKVRGDRVLAELDRLILALASPEAPENVALVASEVRFHRHPGETPEATVERRLRDTKDLRAIHARFLWDVARGRARW